MATHVEPLVIVNVVALFRGDAGVAVVITHAVFVIAVVIVALLSCLVSPLVAVRKSS